MNWSDKQLRIFNEWENTSNNIAVEACPGGSKSTVLLELLERSPSYKSKIFLAFNKSIQQELERKTSEGTETSTLHSLGFKTLLRNTNKKYKVNEIKNFILGRNILELNIKNKEKENAYLFTISRLVDLYRLNMCSSSTELMIIADKYGVDYFNGEIQSAMQLIDYLNDYNNADHEKDSMMIDFVDMLYLPVTQLNDSQFKKYDIVMIDECQDLCSLQWELAKKLFKRRTRFCAVGDGFQSIYSFMGADKEVFNKIKSYPKTTTLPLSYSYRCGKKIVEEASKVFEFIESPEWMQDGEVIKDGNLNDIQAGDFVLCRNNKPLIEVFLELLKNGKKAYILGRDFGNELFKVLNQIETFSKEEIERLKESKLSTLKEKGVKKPINHQSYISLCEKIDILEYLHNHYSSLSKLKQIIKDMFSDSENKDSIMLSTIHKSKGLESENVYVVGFDTLLPYKYAETELDIFQEDCLKYVCVTRAKSKLVFVREDNISITT